MKISTRPRIAIIGSGIAGLTAAYRMSKEHDVTVYEKNDWIGGHTHTVDIEMDDSNYSIDTGFIVFNEWTYPRFLNLLSEIGLQYQNTDMSFGVMSEATGIEYAGNNLSTLFAQRKRFFSVTYHRFLLDIIRFNKRASDDLSNRRISASFTLDDYLAGQAYSDLFKSHYLLPMAAAIWSSDLSDVSKMSALFFIRFFKNHGLLSATDRPQWYTLPGGSSSYIAPLTEAFKDKIHIKTPVVSVREKDQGVEVQTNTSSQLFDGVVLAAHSDQSHKLLGDTQPQISHLLKLIPYASNDVVLHTDLNQMPKNRRAWASWNYQIKKEDAGLGAVVTYDMNRLQNLTGTNQFFVTLNNTSQINPQSILGKWRYSHPQFGPNSLTAQEKIVDVNTNSKVVVAGAWCQNGFHEDGVVSGERAAEALGKTLKTNA